MPILSGLCFLLLGIPVLAQEPAANQYGLRVISDPAVYQQQVSRDRNLELVDLATFIPNLILDIRYATHNNFLGEPVYTLAWD
jgi:D-alanyl-D-alanine dipeptidase